MFRLYLADKKKEVKVEERISLAEAIKLFGYNPEAVIFIKGGVPVPDDQIPEDGDLITVMKAFSGG